MAYSSEEDEQDTIEAEALQGVCKDCHAGTLNNDLYEVFHLISDNDDNEFYACKNCGSTHLDLL